MNYTRNAIIKIFLEELESRSLDNITIKDIIEKAGINRNTFYYHFKDIYDLIDKIFEEELQKRLSEAVEEATFYEEYKKAATIFLEHRKAIIHMEHSKSKYVIYHYIEEISNIYVERFVRRYAKEYDISEEGINFITYFYCSAINSNTIRWIKRGMPGYRDEFLELISTSFESTIKEMIRNYILFEKTNTDKARAVPKK